MVQVAGGGGQLGGGRGEGGPDQDGPGGGQRQPSGGPVPEQVARSVTRPCRDAQRVAAVRNGPAGDPASARASATVVCRRVKAGVPGKGWSCHPWWQGWPRTPVSTR